MSSFFTKRSASMKWLHFFLTSMFFLIDSLIFFPHLLHTFSLFSMKHCGHYPPPPRISPFFASIFILGQSGGIFFPYFFPQGSESRAFSLRCCSLPVNFLKRSRAATAFISFLIIFPLVDKMVANIVSHFFPIILHLFFFMWSLRWNNMAVASSHFSFLFFSFIFYPVSHVTQAATGFLFPPLGWVGFLFFFPLLFSFHDGMKQQHSWWGESHKQPRTLHTSLLEGEIMPSMEGPLVQRLVFKPLCAEGHQDMWENAKYAPGRCAEDLWAFWTVSWWDACRWGWEQARKGQGLCLIWKRLSRGW